MIEIINLSKKFDKFSCLEQVALVIPKGSIYGIIGENGAGKSTLLRLIAGIYRPDEGEIRIEGEKVPGVAAKRRFSTCLTVSIMKEMPHRFQQEIL